MYLNKTYLSGRIVYGPNTKTLPSGTLVSEAGILVESKPSQRSERSLFKVVSFGKLASAFSSSVEEGDKVVVQGRLKQEIWTASDGSNEKRQTIKVIIESFSKIDFKDFSQEDDVDDKVRLNGSNIIYDRNNDEIFLS